MKSATEEINPFIREHKIRVLIKNKDKAIMTTKQLLSGDRIVLHPELGHINTKYLLDTSNKVSIFMTAEMRQIYMNLSGTANKLLRYIEGILRYGDDIVKINPGKFMEEAHIASKTTYYDAIAELCRYGFITPYHKQTYYWINSFVFFNGSRIDKYPNNLELID